MGFCVVLSGFGPNGECGFNRSINTVTNHREIPALLVVCKASVSFSEIYLWNISIK